MAESSASRVSSVNILAGPTTRTWTVAQNAKRYAVQLYHNTITGDRNLSIDGAEVSGTSGVTGMLSSSRLFVFELPGGGKGTVRINHNGTHVEYTCEFNGQSIPEENDLLNGTEGDTVNKLRLNVEAGEIGVDESGKAVVWFRIYTIRENDERESRVHRRFRDFYGINEALRSAYRGSHLLSSFPDLPPRSFKFFEDHLSADFVEKRKWQLQDWLYKVSQIPRMRSNPDFLTFLGCVDNVREVSVLFPKDVSLGLRVRPAGDFVEVAALLPLPDGAPSPAQVSKLIKPGDKISKINGEDCLSDSHDVIVAKLKSAPRPLMIHFLGFFAPTPSTAEEHDDLSAVSMKDFTAALSPVPAPAPAPTPAPATDARAVTGLIGDGISYVGTGATPRPGAPARTGLAHHATADTSSGGFNGLV